MPKFLVETAKGRAMERKHEAHVDAGHKQVKNAGSHARKLHNG